MTRINWRAPVRLLWLLPALVTVLFVGLPAPARAANDWSTVTSPSPASTYDYPNAVSCWSSSGCLSVGFATTGLSGGGSSPNSETWDGTSWQLQPVTVGSLSLAYLGAVSCVSQSFCIAVGNGTDSSSNQRFLVGKWNGSSWSLTLLPTPDAMNDSHLFLTGVSCLSSSDCTATGTYEDSGTADQVVVEHWNGTAWSQDTTMPTPTGGWHLVQSPSISCVPGSSDVCTITGYYTDASSGITALAFGENWPGQSAGWQQQTMAPPPSGGFAPEPVSIACPSMTACFAAGSYSTGSSIALVEKWDGTAWATQTVPSATDAFGNDYTLGAVSCNSDQSCTAVGGYFGGAFAAVHWNGSSWAMQTDESVVPGYGQYVDGVSCPAGASSGDCTAVGDYYDHGEYNGAYVNQALAMRWTGSAWTLSGPVTPPGRLGFDQLASVSCTSTTACAAVGYEGGYNWDLPVAEMWDGNSWTLRHVPLADENGGWDGSRLSSVSCGSASACTAVGSSNYGSGGDQPLAEHWNGSAWTQDAVSSIHPPTGTGTFVAEGLTGVSCWGASSCMAIGRWNQGSGFMSESWNGSAWTATAIPAPPVPSGATQANLSDLTAISCASDGTCMAVGTYAYVPSGALNANFAPIAEHWDGSGWTAVVPALASGVTGGNFYGVSCASSTVCMAVGRDYVSSNDVPLAMEWTGSGWSDASAAAPASATMSDLQSVSCASTTACTAVGYSGAQASTVTESWTSGGGWVMQTPDPGVAGSLWGVSCASSGCFATGSAGDGTTLIQSDGITTPAVQTLSISHAGAGTGTITGRLTGSAAGDSIDCWDGEICSDTYAHGASVTLTATPNSTDNSSFTGWSGGGCSGTGSCTVPMSQDQAVTASFALNPPAPPPPSNSAVPTIKYTGSAQEGNTLTADPGSWNPTPTGYSYQWVVCDVNANNCSTISGATGATHLVTAADVGHTLRVLVSAIGTSGTSAPVPSVPSPTVIPAAPAPGGAPPSISGNPVVGVVLNESHGAWTGSPTGYGVYWERCSPAGDGCTLTNVTGQSFKLFPGDAGHTFRVLENASNAGGTSANPWTSPPTAVVQSASGTGTTPTTTTTTTTTTIPAGAGSTPLPPTAGQITVVLAGGLKVSGPAATIVALMRSGGFPTAFTAPSAGLLAIGWYAGAGTAPDIRAAVAAAPVLIAGARVAFHAAGRANVEIKLTKAGRKLLSHAHRLTITAKGAFAPVGGKPVSLSRRIVLKRH